MAKAKAQFTKDNEYYTPKEFVARFGKFDYDPATTKEKALEFGIENYDTIEKDMNSRNSTSKRKETIVDNSKTRKKREELSISATKSIKKEDVEIVVQFH